MTKNTHTHWKRPLLALLASCVLLGATPASAADTPALLYRQGRDGEVSLSLTGLDEAEHIYAVQLELTLDGTCQKAEFTSSIQDAYTPPCTVQPGQRSSTVILYMDLGDNPVAGSRLSLGTLELDRDYATPSSAKLTLLDRGLEAFSGANGTAVKIDSGSGGSSSGSGSDSDSDSDSDSSSSGSSSRPGSGNQTRPSTPSTKPSQKLPFTDVPENAWYHTAVAYAYENGLMSGTSSSTFHPQQTTTRGMIVMILYNLEGRPAAKANPGFTDVSTQYYAGAVAWAAEQGIVSGYGNGHFGPDDPITREQMAVILSKYAQFKGYDTSIRADLSSFRDAGSISRYAVEPMRWANGAGLINGMGDSTLLPGGSATRAQAASILMNFCEHVR